MWYRFGSKGQPHLFSAQHHNKTSRRGRVERLAIHSNYQLARTLALRESFAYCLLSLALGVSLQVPVACSWSLTTGSCRLLLESHYRFLSLAPWVFTPTFLIRLLPSVRACMCPILLSSHSGRPGRMRAPQGPSHPCACPYTLKLHLPLCALTSRTPHLLQALTCSCHLPLHPCACAMHSLPYLTHPCFPLPLSA